MDSSAELKSDLARAAKVKDPAERSIRIATVLTKALAQINREPILVGGAAVEFYTQGGYSTSDIDMVAPGGPELVRVMEDLGFEKLGKDFVEQQLKIYVEFPGSALKPNERYQEIRIGDTLLKIISLEDLIVDRLCAFKFWQSAVDGINAMVLLDLGPLDEDHLKKRYQEEDVVDAIVAVREIREQVIRKRLNKNQGDQLLLERMKKLKPA